MKNRILTLLTALFAIVWSAQADEITSMKLTISHNGGDFFEVAFPAEGWPDLDLTDEPTTSIRIKSIEVQTSGTVSNVVFSATMYKTEKGMQPDEEWRTFDLPQQGNTWKLDFGDEAPDLIDSEMGSSPRTFRFFVQAKDGKGNDIYYNNGGADYKVLFAKNGGSQPSDDGIKSFSMTISCDGEVFTVPFPASDWPEQRIEGQTKSIKIVRAEVETDPSISYVGFIATMYDASDGWQHHDDEWRVVGFENRGGGHWVIDMGEGQELVESDWLTKNKTKTFEFFIYADSGEGTSSFHYNNGGQNYKVTFSTGEGGGGGQDQDWKVKFYKESTATLSLIVNGEEQSYVFDGNGARQPNTQPGDAYSLAIDGFTVAFIHNDNVKVNDVSIQYKLYQEGQDGGWNRIDATSAYSEEVYNSEKDRMEHRVICSAYNLGHEVAVGLEYGKNHVLEVNYQVVTSDGEYFFLGKGKEGSYFRFYFDTETGVSLTPAPSPRRGEEYNLAGQRVGEGYKGIVVNNGKKVLRK